MKIILITIFLFFLSAPLMSAENNTVPDRKTPGVVEFLPGDVGLCKSDAFGSPEANTEKTTHAKSNYIEIKQKFIKLENYHGCFADSLLVIDKIRNGKSSVIDVRPGSEYKNYQINGSLNIPANRLASKTYLKNSSLILVDHGYEQDKLYSLCNSLHDKGFKNIVVLEGGINTWRKQAGLFVGQQAKNVRFISVLPRMVLSGKDNWLLVNTVEKNTGKNIKAHIIQHPLNPQDGNKLDRWAIELMKKVAATQVKSKVKQNIAIMNQQGVGYSAMAKAIDNAGIDQVYYIDGGVAALNKAYASYVATKNRVPLSKRMPKCKS